MIEALNPIPTAEVIKWSELKDDPDRLMATIETEAQRFTASGTFLSQGRLARAGLNSLSHAITKFYPGGYRGLKEKLGIPARIANDYSRAVTYDEYGIPRDQRGRMFVAVLKDQPDRVAEVIETEARRLQAEGTRITDKSLKANHQSGFVGLVQRYYPGGMLSLREKLGKPHDQRPNGFWQDPANIEAEARRLVAIGNNLTQRELKEVGLNTLSHAARDHYPGSIRQLRANLGLINYSNPRGYWNPTTIESEVERFMASGGRLSQTALSKAGLSALVAAIQAHYPGGMTSLREHFDQPRTGKPSGYWQDVQTIEAEARKLVEAGNPMTHTSITEAGAATLLDAARRHYPGGMRALKAKLGVQETSRPNGYWTVKTIEQEAREFYQQEGHLTGAALTSAKRQALLGAITSKYPGGMSQLKINLGIELASKPEGYWTPEKILLEARDFCETEGRFTHNLLQEKGRSDLSTAIYSKYPGGMRQLREDLGLVQLRTPSDYWTPERVEEEARAVIQSEGKITQQVLRRLNKALIRAIAVHYPGGMVALKEKFGIEPNKPASYWTAEIIEEQASEVVRKYGKLSQELLASNGLSPLRNAISKSYPGGMFELCRKLGVESPVKPKGYWTPEIIEAEAALFLEGHGALTGDLLGQHGLSGLSAAIAKYYPGGMRGLKEKLGIPINQRPDGFWQDPVNIEAEASKLLAAGVHISQRSIYLAGMGVLNAAISKYYPGGMAGLKEKLGIVDSQEIISSEEANQQLERLLEG